MKKLSLIFVIATLLLALAMPAFAANSKTGNGETGTYNDRMEGVSVDTDPGASGYWSDPVFVLSGKDNAIWFSITAITGATVTLQFKDVGQSTWSEYGTYTEITNLKIEANPGSQWRCGVADDNQGTSSVSQISW